MMAQCEALTQAGSRCQRNAMEGERFCSSHQGAAEPAPDLTPAVGEEENLGTMAIEETTPEEETPRKEAPVRVIHENKLIPVLYTGGGSYSVPSVGADFNVYNRVQEVPRKIAEYLTQEMPEMFRIHE